MVEGEDTMDGQAETLPVSPAAPPRQESLVPVYERYTDTLTQRKGYVRFDEERKNQFLTALAETGLQALSARLSGVSVQTIQNHRKSDPVFEEAYLDAEGHYHDSIVAEMARRGHYGYDEPLVFQGKKTGHYVRRYSDRLLERLAEARVPGFGRKTEVDVNVKGGVLLVHTAAKDANDWAAKYGDEPPKLPKADSTNSDIAK